MDESLHFRLAQVSDLPELIQMLVDDRLGSFREDFSDPINPRYLDAFKAIEKDPNNELIVVEWQQQLAGMLQLTYIPYLSHMGSWRCMIEAVRVASHLRGRGFGTQMFQWSIDQARKRGCAMVQLTSNKQRSDAIRFYRALGFVDSHEGFKLYLDSAAG